MFAKLYGADDDQVLVMLETDEKGDPCIRCYSQPKNLGLCSFGISFKDTDAGWDQAESVFAAMNEEKARAAVEEAIGHFAGAVTQGD